MRGLVALLVLCAWPSLALAWEPFRSQSRDVERGNEHMRKGQAAEALEAYDTAAKKLPNEPGVQLNRGLALMALGKLGPAREALRNATQGNGPADLRGGALYDLGLAFMQEADAAQKGGEGANLDAAQKSLQEAVDAFKGSLRAKAGNRDAAWNLELARRRLVEVQKKQEEKKKQDEQKKKDEEQKKDEQKNDQDGGPPPDQGDAGAEQPKDDQGDQKKDDGDKQDQKKPDEGKGDEKKPEPKDGNKPEDAQKPEPKPSQQQPQQQQPNQAEDGQPRLPEHMRKALDALEAGEENLEKHRAQLRARQRPRRIEKDW
jgi:tetratricopeptide (TPR) repeat protein